MNYYDSKKSKRPNTALYILIACALIAVGIIVWFIVSRQVKDNNNGNDNTSMLPSQVEKFTDSASNFVESYIEDDSSYNNNSDNSSSHKDNYNNGSVIDDSMPMESSGVANTVSDVPYEAKPKSAPIMPIDGEIIKDYNAEALQYSATYNDLRLHTAIDIAAESGSTVKAATDGTVLSTDESATLGKTVTIDHGNGIIMKYCGLDKVSVSEGKKISMGDPIGIIGSIPSECADKSHLHLEATIDGKEVSPLEIIGKIPE